MTDLERMKLKAELMRVQAAKAEMEYTIAQKQEEIERIKAHILVQIEKEEELTLKLKE